MVFTESSDFRSEVCWGQRDPWTPLPRVMGLEEFEVVKKLVELLESWKGRRCWLWTYQKQKIWGRVAGFWILPHMQRAAPWGTGDGVVNFPVRFARRSGFQMLATARTTNLLKWPGCKGWRWAGLFLRIEIRLFDFGFFHRFWPALCTTTHLSFSDSCQQFVLVMTCLEGSTSATLLRLWMILSWNLYRICRPPSPLVKGALVREADGGRAQALRPCGLKSLELVTALTSYLILPNDGILGRAEAKASSYLLLWSEEEYNVVSLSQMPLLWPARGACEYSSRLRGKTPSQAELRSTSSWTSSSVDFSSFFQPEPRTEKKLRFSGVGCARG